MSDALPLSDLASPRSRLRADTLTDSVLILMVMMIVQRVVGLLRSIVFCRWLSVDELGRWEMAFAFLLLAAPASVLALSGCFRRYVPYYDQRGQLRRLIGRTALLHLLLGSLAVSGICLFRRQFAELIFGSSADVPAVVLMGASLVGVLGFHFFLDLLPSVRNVRVNAILQLVNSLAFAGLGIGLLASWRCDAESVIVAYGLSCAIAAAVGIGWLGRAWRQMPEGHETIGMGSMLAKIVPFAVSLWFTSLLTNFFLAADRYLIIHCTGVSAETALSLVGNYHSARLVPLLLVSAIDLLAVVAIPYLSCDWEAGNRQRTADRLNLLLKLSGLAVLLGSTAIVALGPVLFRVILQGKYPLGEAILPWTVAFCAWYGLMSVAQCYLVCAERAATIAIARLVGLVAVVALNLLLLPRFGLEGAAMAAAGANVLSLLLVLAFSHRLGFRLDRGTLLLLALPVLFPLGIWPMLVAVGVVLWDATCGTHLLSPAEKERILDRAGGYWDRIRRVNPRP